MSRQASVPEIRTSREQFPTATSRVAASYRLLTGSIEPQGHDFLKVAVVAEGTGLHVSSYGTTSFGPWGGVRAATRRLAPVRGAG